MDEKGKIRLGQTLTFDPNKEQDIIEGINKLKSNGKLAAMLSHMLRLAFESPEAYADGDQAAKLIRKMFDFGVTPTRYNYFNQVAKEVEAMKKKVDAIYDMTYNTYMLAQMGKYIGLESKSDNTLRATFLLEKQITDMCNTLGIDDLNYCYSSNKLEDMHNRADKVMEFILGSFDGIVKELKTTIVNEQSAFQPLAKQSFKPVVPQQKVNKSYNFSEEVVSDEDVIELSSKPDKESDGKAKKEDNLTVKPLDEDRANKFLAMLGEV